MEKPQRSLSIQQVANLLGVSKRTVRRLVDDGRLGAFLVRGGSLRVTEQSVLNFQIEAIRAYREARFWCDKE
ncbi:helix-turn-helix domain-containing protein [Desulfatirhabdium butyrativorans]|uniref:helix-turn-helix domain-containing protein n=1 Tax=Desulfatirhabdium butyrativorans TaxID=340467 RepID=UPI000558DA67|nr:helix-turn-helix domain-containing protein [Desulfatirhabdium butyrativorans]